MQYTNPTSSRQGKTETKPSEADTESSGTNQSRRNLPRFPIETRILTTPTSQPLKLVHNYLLRALRRIGRAICGVASIAPTRDQQMTGSTNLGTVVNIRITVPPGRTMLDGIVDSIETGNTSRTRVDQAA